MNFTSDIVVGLEIHAELDTKTKLFCSCATKGGDEPNTRVCPICLGHPGTRPVLNRKALEYAIKLCLALDLDISKELIFSRKSYFYPDMSKNFQITQFEEPLGKMGKLKLNPERSINITRIHIEEDPASISYPKSMADSPFAFIDYNRSGNPLVEIVTEPEMTSPAEARDFLNKLIIILSYLKIFDINNCIIKADANMSLRESGYTRVEIKNITGFKELERALNYEITRQRMLLRRGLKIKRETRGWDNLSRTTKSLRTKETEEDYGYIIEPDLPIVDISDELVSGLKKEIPELAHQKAERYVKEHKLDKVDAEVMSAELELASLFEKVAEKVDPVLAARWMRRELLRVLNYNRKSIKDIKFDETHLIELFSLVETKTVSDSTAQRLMEKLMEKAFSPKEYVKKNHLEQVSGDDEIRGICRKVISENPKAVSDFKAGGKKAAQFLVGQVMRATKGKAEPGLTNKLIMEELSKSH